MATRIRKGARPHLYIGEHMARRGVTDERLANRLGRARETIWRWRVGKRRVTEKTLAELAHGLDPEMKPEDFFRPPEPEGPKAPSLDDLVENAPEEVRAMAFDVVKRLVGRSQ